MDLSRFSELDLSWNLFLQMHVLLQDFTYRHNSCGRDVLITVPKGFKTDFDSVPRIPIAYAWLKGRARCSAVVHDWLYYSQSGKDYADRVFLDAMRDEGVPWRYRYPIYWGVRIGGAGPYREHGKRRA